MPEPTHSHPAEMALHEYLDGALAPAARAAVETHLAGCPRCTARLVELQALFAALEALPDLSLQRDLGAAVLEAIRPPEVVAPPALRWAAVAQLAAAIALLLFAWPMVAGQVAELAPAQIGAQIVAGLTDRLPLPFAWWPTMLASATEISVPSLGVTRYVPALQLSPHSWWLLIAGALVLWLAGNGLLLRWFSRQPKEGQPT